MYCAEATPFQYELVLKLCMWIFLSFVHCGIKYKKIKNIKNVKRCRDGMPKSMQTR